MEVIGGYDLALPCQPLIGIYYVQNPPFHHSYGEMVSCILAMDAVGVRFSLVVFFFAGLHKPPLMFLNACISSPSPCGHIGGGFRPIRGDVRGVEGLKDGSELVPREEL